MARSLKKGPYIEAKLEKKDAWAMKTIIKHYQKMWT